jgi:hypothetical protein
MTTNTITAETVQLPEGVKDTPKVRAVYAAMLNGVTGSPAKIAAESGVIVASTRAALNILKAAGIATATEAAKVGEAAQWALVAEDAAEAEQAHAAAEASQDAEVNIVVTDAAEVAAILDGIAEKTATVAAELVLGTNAKKAIVANLVMQAVGNLLEFWDEMGDERVSHEDAQTYAALWMSYTSGRGWDPRLGPVPSLKK